MKKALLISSIFFLLFSSASAQTFQDYNYSLVPTSFSFTRDLGKDMSGQDVKYLQCILGVAPLSGYFGDLTKAGLIRYQNDHAEEVLTPVGLTTGTGFMGSSTRNYINAQIATDGSTSGSRCGGTTGGSTSSLPPGCISTNGYSATTGIRCNTGSSSGGTNSSQGSSGGQQGSLTSLLPLLPYLIAQQGGGTQLRNPNLPFNATTNPLVSNPNSNTYPPVNNQGNTGGGTTGGGSTNTGCYWPNRIDYTNGQCVTSTGQVVCPPGQEFSYPMNGCTNSTNGGGSNSGNTQDPTFFGGTTLYNSEHLNTGYNSYVQIDANTQVYSRPCNASPRTYLYVNQNEAGNSNPVFLLIKTNETIKINGHEPVNGTCVIGRIRPLTSSDRCVTYYSGFPNTSYELDRTFTPLITGVITTIRAAAGGQDGACVPAPN